MPHPSSTRWSAAPLAILRKPWPATWGVVLLAVLNILMFAYARALGVFPQMAMWGASFYSHVGLPTPSPFIPYPVKPILSDMNSMLDLGIIAGAITTALLASEWKFRREGLRGALTGVAGGVLMGFGTVLMPPCNMGGFWTATMALSLSGPVAAIGLLAGAYVGGKVLRAEVRREIESINFDNLPSADPVRPDRSTHQQIAGLVMVLLLVTITALYLHAGAARVAALFLFGIGFGIIMQRSRFCFVAAFRDLTVSRDGRLMKWTLASIALGVLPFALLKAHGHDPMHMVFPVGLHTVYGGFLFGVGMTVAGGCGLGILVRSGEGYMRSWLALLAGMLTAGSWVHIYGAPVGKGGLYGRPVFLPHVLGWPGAIAAIFAFLAIFYVAIRFIERSHDTHQSHKNRAELLPTRPSRVDVSLS